jgi:stearoyl-CoA desaturase (delta-9 desaturase)
MALIKRPLPTLQIAVQLGAAIGLFFYFDWALVALSYGIGFLFYIGVAAGFHRLFCHKSYKTSRAVEVVLLTLGSLATLGSSTIWVLVHRTHHASPDRKGDPHSPQELGFYRAWIGPWNKIRYKISRVADLRKDPLHRFFYDHYFKILIGYAAVLFLISPQWAVYGYLLPATMAYHASTLGAAISHLHGYRTYDTKDNSRNSWIVHFITPGEGWHNNHHADPTNFDTRVKWWEFDPIATVVRLIRTE